MMWKGHPMTKERYREYLRSAEWQRLRAARIVFDACHCRGCGITGVPLEVHHIRYPAHAEETTIYELESLCRECHQKKEDINKIINDAFVFGDPQEFINSALGDASPKGDEIAPPAEESVPKKRKPKTTKWLDDSAEWTLEIDESRDRACLRWTAEAHEKLGRPERIQLTFDATKPHSTRWVYLNVGQGNVVTKLGYCYYARFARSKTTALQNVIIPCRGIFVPGNGAPHIELVEVQR